MAGILKKTEQEVADDLEAIIKDHRERHFASLSDESPALATEMKRIYEQRKRQIGRLGSFAQDDANDSGSAQ